MYDTSVVGPVLLARDFFWYKSEGVTNVAEGDRVAALTNFGSCAEYIYWDEEKAEKLPILEAAKANELLESG